MGFVPCTCLMRLCKVGIPTGGQSNLVSVLCFKGHSALWEFVVVGSNIRTHLVGFQQWKFMKKREGGGGVGLAKTDRRKRRTMMAMRRTFHPTWVPSQTRHAKGVQRILRWVSSSVILLG